MQILRASAGSGKTFALAYEYIKNVINAPEKYSVILAVTFTNKATDEMKRRILKELDLLRTPTQPKRHAYLDRLISELQITETQVAKNAKLALSNILHDYSRFSVLTIDRFFQKILRAFVKELGVESDYTVDFNIDYIIDLAIDKIVDKSNDDTDIAANLKGFTDELIDNSKSYNIKSALAQYAKKIFSEEFDTNKNEGLNIFYSNVIEQRNILIDEMANLANYALQIISNNGFTVDDFPRKKSGLFGYLQNVANKDIKGYNSYVAAAVDGNWGKGKSLPKGVTIKNEITPILSQICSSWDENKVFLSSVEVFAKNFRKFMLLGDISNEVDDVCATSNIMLLSTTMRLMTALTNENDAPFIYEKCGNSYEVFMIDEFQDTSVRQWDNFLPLIDNALSQCEEIAKCVTIVGDVKQSIYRWRGGDWKLLQGNLKDRITLKNKIEETTLDTNWRSSRMVVAFNNALIGAVADSLNSQLNNEIDNIKEAGNITLEQRNELTDTLKKAYNNAEQKFAAKNNAKTGYISIAECDFSEQENLARMVASIKDIQDRGCEARDIAIITRTNKDAKNVVESLLAQKDIAGNENYCFDAISNQALYLTNSKAVKLIITIFKLGLINFTDNPLLVAEYNKYLNRDLNCEVLDDEQRVIAQIRELSVIEAFEKIIDYFNPAKTQNDVAYIQALYEQIINFSAQNVTDVAMFLDWWDKENGKLSITLPDGQNAINVITIHSVKGLEYEAVLIPYMNWKLEPMTNDQIWAEQNSGIFDFADNTLVPYVNMLGESNFAYTYCKEKVMSYVDNVNVLYVAVTRAAKELHIMLPTKIGSKTVAEGIMGVLTCYDKDVILGDDSKSGGNLDTKIEGNIKSWSTLNGESRTEYVFGEKINFLDGKEQEKTLSSILIDELKSLDYHKNDRIQLRYSTERYYEDETGEKHLTPRSYGILMHKLFERIESYNDVVTELEAMRIDGILTKAECEEIASLVTRAFKNENILQFFDTDWSVKNEQNILRPNFDEKVVSLRPDRVIISENKAKILDYKFGRTKNDKNLSQMRNYVHLLKYMGYEEVEGYIWYVQLNDVDKVTSETLTL
ncbi:MAG: UvrD-helicase domain-containing protein [Rikenellaceae bacterium]